MKRDTRSTAPSGNTSPAKSTKLRRGRLSPVLSKDGSSVPVRMRGWTRVWKDKQIFHRYVDGLRDARDFMSEGKANFLFKNVKPHHRKAILEQLSRVDPEGMKELRTFMQKLRFQKRREKDLMVQDGAKELDLIVAEAEFQDEGIIRARYVPSREILVIIATYLASGYSRREVCAKLGISSELVARVTTEDIAAIRKKLPEAIVLAADSKVMSDLLDGRVTEETSRADMIASRRRKIQLDVFDRSKDAGKNRPDASENKKDQADFFGGKTIEVKEEDSEDSSTGQVGKDR